MITAFIILYAIVLAISYVLYNRMVDKLRVKHPSVTAVNMSFRRPLPGNFALYRKEFRDQKDMMRLWWAARVLRWVAIFSTPFLMVAVNILVNP
jgi:hypothetical protein